MYYYCIWFDFLWIGLYLVPSCQKWFEFWIFLKKFLFIEQYHFKSTFVIDFFLTTSIFKTLYFLKRCPIFDDSTLSIHKNGTIISLEYVDFWPKINLIFKKLFTFRIYIGSFGWKQKTAGWFGLMIDGISRLFRSIWLYFTLPCTPQRWILTNSCLVLCLL